MIKLAIEIKTLGAMGLLAILLGAVTACGSDSSTLDEETLADLESLPDQLAQPATPDPRQSDRSNPWRDQERTLQEDIIAKARRGSARQDQELETISVDQREQEEWAETYRPPPKHGDAADEFLYGRALMSIANLGAPDHYTLARYQFERALSRQEWFPEASLYLGKLSIGEGKWHEAQRHLKDAKEGDPNLVEAWLLLAQTHDHLDEKDKAVQVVMGAIAEGYGEPDCQLWLARLYEREREPQKIVDLLEPLLEKYDNIDLLHYRLGTAYGALGLSDKAADHMVRALELIQKGWDQLLRYADILRRAERYDEAIEILNKILEEAPQEFFDRLPNGRGDVEKILRFAQEEKSIGQRKYFSDDENIAILHGGDEIAAERRVEAALRFEMGVMRVPIQTTLETVGFMLRDSEPRVQVVAVKILSLFAQRGIMEQESGIVLERLLVDHIGSNPARTAQVRVAACDGLQRLRSVKAVQCLVAMLQHEEPSVFHRARRALQDLSGGNAMYVGDPSVLDDDPALRVQVYKDWVKWFRKWKQTQGVDR